MAAANTAAAGAATPAPAPAAPAAPVQVPRGQVDLADFIHWTGVECLNQDSSHSITNALKQGYREDEGLYLVSDSDEQLLIYIPFMQVVKLHSALFKGPEEDDWSSKELLMRIRKGFTYFNSPSVLCSHQCMQTGSQKSSKPSHILISLLQNISMRKRGHLL